MQGRIYGSGTPSRPECGEGGPVDRTPSQGMGPSGGMGPSQGMGPWELVQGQRSGRTNSRSEGPAVQGQ